MNNIEKKKMRNMFLYVVDKNRKHCDIKNQAQYHIYHVCFLFVYYWETRHDS